MSRMSSHEHKIIRESGSPFIRINLLALTHHAHPSIRTPQEYAELKGAEVVCSPLWWRECKTGQFWPAPSHLSPVFSVKRSKKRDISGPLPLLLRGRL